MQLPPPLQRLQLLLLRPRGYGSGSSDCGLAAWLQQLNNRRAKPAAAAHVNCLKKRQLYGSNSSYASFRSELGQSNKSGDIRYSRSAAALRQVQGFASAAQHVLHQLYINLEASLHPHRSSNISCISARCSYTSDIRQSSGRCRSSYNSYGSKQQCSRSSCCS